MKLIHSIDNINNTTTSISTIVIMMPPSIVISITQDNCCWHYYDLYLYIFVDKSYYVTFGTILVVIFFEGINKICLTNIILFLDHHHSHHYHSFHHYNHYCHYHGYCLFCSLRILVLSPTSRRRRR